MRKRLSILGLLLACVSSFLNAKGGPKPLAVYDFSKGADTYHAGTMLPDGFVQDSLNVLFDDQAPGTKRLGYTVAWSTKQYSFTGLWTYTDSSNTTWQIARSSDQITASNLGGTIVKISTVSANDTVGEASAFGNAYFVDPTQGVYYWNGTATTYVSGSPKGSIITQFHNRLWVTGAAVPNGNQLYGSKYYDGTTWTTGLNATDPVQYSVGLQDNFDNVTAEYVYLDTLYLFKHFTIFALYGFDETNFQISQITQECGCIDGNTIQTYNGGLKLVSLRGVENFDGYHCTRISDPIKNKVDPAIQTGGFSQQSWIQQTATDWTNGTLSPPVAFSTTSAAPALTIQTSTAVRSSADFPSGSFSGTYLSAIGVNVSTNTGNVPNNSFETALDGVQWGGSWVRQLAPITGDHCSIGARTGSYFATPFGGENSITVQVRDFTTNAIYVQTTVTGNSNSCSYTAHTLTLPASSANRGIFIQMLNNDGVPSDLLDSGIFTSNGVSITFYTASDTVGGTMRIVVDDVTGGLSTPAAGTYTSPSIDLSSATSVILSSITFTGETSIQGPTVTMQTSTNNAAWSDLAPTLSNASPYATYGANRYVRFISSWTSFGGSVPAISSASYVYISSPAVFTSAVHSVSGITSWGNLTASQDLSNGGNIAYAICVSSSSTMVPKTCTNQTANAQILGSTNTWATIVSSWTVSFTTQTPKLNSLTLNWFTGNRAIPMASTVWDNRYWLSIATNTADSGNDAVLVLNSRGAWAPFDIHAGAFTQYKNSLYHADSLGSGNIFLDNQGTGDNGNPINAYLKTKDFSLGSLAADQFLESIYPAASNTGSCAMTVQYDMDHSGTNMSLGSPQLSEFADAASVKLPVPVDTTHQVFGKTTNFTFGTNDSQCAWKFYGFEGIYQQRNPQ